MRWECVGLGALGLPVYLWSWHLTDPGQAELAVAAAFLVSYVGPFVRWAAYLVSRSEEFLRWTSSTVSLETTMRTLSRFLLLLALPAAASAQANPAVTTTRELWRGVTANITAAAEELTDAQYAYKPAETVRSMGQLIGHVAGAQNMICAAALGEPPRAEDEIERTQTTKAGLLAALKASTTYCERAYAQSDAAAQQVVRLFGRDGTRLYALVLNATHNAEHYGNIVTYMRMNGLVPPSSRPR